MRILISIGDISARIDGGGGVRTKLGDCDQTKKRPYGTNEHREDRKLHFRRRKGVSKSQSLFRGHFHRRYVHISFRVVFSFMFYVSELISFFFSFVAKMHVPGGWATNARMTFLLMRKGRKQKNGYLRPFSTVARSRLSG